MITPRNNLESPVNLTSMFSWLWEETVVPGEKLRLHEENMQTSCRRVPAKGQTCDLLQQSYSDCLDLIQFSLKLQNNAQRLTHSDQTRFILTETFRVHTTGIIRVKNYFPTPSKPQHQYM